MDQSCDIAIVGAGAAGLATAIFAAGSPSILLFDGAARPGAKILVSGGSRCNVTNREVSERDFWGGRSTIVRRILRAFPPAQTIAWFDTIGVRLHEEAGGKLFPDTNRARDVLAALLNAVNAAGAELRAAHRVTAIERRGQGFEIITPHGVFGARAVVLATGGQSLPKSGSDGAGYEIARRLGHTIVQTTPALVPLVFGAGTQALPYIPREASGTQALPDIAHEASGTQARPDIAHDSSGTQARPYNPVEATATQAHFNVHDLRGGEGFPSGVSHDAELAVWVDGRIATRLRGSLLWTHFGISGPVALDASRHWLRATLEQRDVRLTVSFAPGETFDAIDARLVEAARRRPRLSIGSALGERLPASISAALLARCSVDPSGEIGRLTREERRRIAAALAETQLPVTGCRGYNYAEVTAGGVALDEIDPATMESRVCRGLYLVGEILDVDGRIGGFNFQWAWASAFVAGRALTKSLIADC